MALDQLRNSVSVAAAIDHLETTAATIQALFNHAQPIVDCGPQVQSLTADLSLAHTKLVQCLDPLRECAVLLGKLNIANLSVTEVRAPPPARELSEANLRAMEDAVAAADAAAAAVAAAQLAAPTSSVCTGRGRTRGRGARKGGKGGAGRRRDSDVFSADDEEPGF